MTSPGRTVVGPTSPGDSNVHRELRAPGPVRKSLSLQVRITYDPVRIHILSQQALRVSEPRLGNRCGAGGV